VFAFRDQLAGLGRVGVLTTEFFKAPHFGGFRDAMAHPLLLDMAIHQLDSARFLLGQDPVSVYCQEFNPAWSWYAGDAGCTAIFEMADGARYIFTGSWCSPGLETSWNGSWRGSGEFGSARWNGDDAPEVQRIDGDPVPPESPGTTAPGPPGDGIAGSLREFVAALRTGAAPMGEVVDNVMSLAMVEAAIESNAARRPVSLASSLSDALDRAIAQEQRHDVGRVLDDWRSQGRFARAD
jgi:predicted dehydrogenase